jgi:hypothetical protein
LARWREGSVAPGIPEVVSRRGELRGIFIQAVLAGWFWVFMTTHSNGMSARQLEDQLGVTCCGSRRMEV